MHRPIVVIGAVLRKDFPQTVLPTVRAYFGQDLEMFGLTLDGTFGVADLLNAASRNPAVRCLGLNERILLRGRHELASNSGERTVLTALTTAGDGSVAWLSGVGAQRIHPNPRRRRSLCIRLMSTPQAISAQQDTTEMSTMNMHIGLIGLGKMGASMRTRLRENGVEVTGYDRNADVTDVATLQDLVDALPSPKAVWVMVPSGAITKAVITEVGELLGTGDLVIDGGNSRFSDDFVHAALLAEKGIDYIDAGVSGGV